MNCKRYQSWIMQAALGAMDASRQAQLNGHLAACAACRKLFAAERQRVEAIDRGLVESVSRQPSPGFAGRLRARLAAEAQQGQPRFHVAYRHWASACATGLAVLALLVIAWLWHRPQPVQPAARESATTGTTLAVVPTSRVATVGRLAPISRVGRRSRRSKEAKQRHHRSRLIAPDRPPQLRVVVRPGQWAALVALYQAAQSDGRVDASSLTRDATSDGSMVELKPIELKPLTFDQVQDSKTSGSPGL